MFSKLRLAVFLKLGDWKSLDIQDVWTSCLTSHIVYQTICLLKQKLRSFQYCIYSEFILSLTQSILSLENNTNKISLHLFALLSALLSSGITSDYPSMRIKAIKSKYYRPANRRTDLNSSAVVHAHFVYRSHSHDECVQKKPLKSHGWLCPFWLAQ